MTNCTKEYSLSIVEKYWQREWEKIKQIEFPKTREHEITAKECKTELINLRDGFKSNKANSKTIVKFHKSMRYANRKNYYSPYNYWQLLKQDANLFKSFYENRLRCSDWFKEKQGANFHYLAEGYVPEFIYGIGLSTSRKAPFVSYFKPALTKNIITKYLNDYDTVLDPCSGYSGRLIGTLCSNKNYIGIDINNTTIQESQNIYNFIHHMFYKKVTLINADSTKYTMEAPCLLTCTPYEDIEEWDDNGTKITSKLTCDEWIEQILNNYKCKKYVFVTDDKITKYKNNIVEELTNTSHFGSNKEYIVIIEE